MPQRDIGIGGVFVCLSVRLSVTLWYWLKTNDRKITQFHRRVAQIFIPTLIAYVQGTPHLRWFRAKLGGRVKRRKNTQIFNQ